MRRKRLEPVHELALEAERAAARRLAEAERDALDCQARLTQLETYEREYRVGLQRRVAEGIGAAGLRDFQSFLARLDQAVGQQRAVLERALTARESAREQWLALSARRRSVGKVLEQSETEDRRALERREQRELDERAMGASRESCTDEDAGRGRG
jgi:flagellar FliJ protein